MKDFVLSIDCGTQSIRAIVFDKLGYIKCQAVKTFEPYFSVGPKACEQDPALYWYNLILCMNELSSEYNEILSEVEAITVTTMRDTGVLLDKEGQVCRPSILWLDEREALCEKPFSLPYRMAFKMIGMLTPLEVTRKQCKTTWIQENDPEAWDKAEHYLLLSGYFHYMLTGQIIDSIGNQIGHIPFLYKSQQWPSSSHAYQWQLFPMEKEKLPKLVKSGTIIGTLSKKAASTLHLSEKVKVIASGSDKGCETLGVGCLNPSTASISFGTTATIQTMTQKYMEPIRFMPSYPAVVDGRFNPEIQVYRGYWMIRWFKDEFAHEEKVEAERLNIIPEEILNKKLDEIPAGSEGLLLQPFWKPGLKQPEAKGSIIGFSDVHSKGHIYRAIIEGINYALLEGLYKIEKKTRQKVDTIYVSGGGSKSDAICQITADMFNRKVFRGETIEASSLGAAMNAFVGLGVYNSPEEAVKNMVRYKDEFIPNPQNAKRYKELYYRIYKKIYPRLKKLYEEMKEMEETIIG